MADLQTELFRCKPESDYSLPCNTSIGFGQSLIFRQRIAKVLPSGNIALEECQFSLPKTQALSALSPIHSTLPFQYRNLNWFR
jgi:hypothetical protein